MDHELNALPGFLGLKTDWDIFSSLPIQPHSIHPKSNDTFWKWTERFNTHIQTHSKSPRILMGYSLGGRLAMHALIQNPSLWKGAIIISAHPGLTSPEEKNQRYSSDLVWADKFTKDPWDNLMHDWEGQEVFKGPGFAFQRKEQDYSRHELAAIMCTFSLGKQEDLRPSLLNLKIPLLWIAGEKDPKYSQLMKAVVETHSYSQVWIASEAGHRVPWQQTFSFTDRISQFLQQLEAS